MKGWQARVIEELGRLVSRLHSEAPPSPPGPLRLDEAIPARSPLEDIQGGYRVVEEYVDARLLRPRRVPGPRDASRHLVLAVDSSARSIELPGASVVVASVAVAANLAPGLAGWPGVSSRPLPGVEEPFIYILPNSEGVEFEEWPATSRNPAGDPYGPDYSLAQAMDEARVRLENAALKAIARLGLEGEVPLEDAIVVVDGPLYPVTGALEAPGVPEAYRRAWRTLLEGRVEAVRLLEEAGALVVGVVKRIEQSRLIARTGRLRRAAEACMPRARGYTDKLALYHSMRPPCLRGAPGRVYATPVIRVESPYSPAKRAQYLVVPLARHLHGPESARYYRAETTLDSPVEPVAPVILDSASRGAVAPLTLSSSDRRAKAETQVLQSMARMEAWRRGVPVSYSSLVEAVASGRV